MACATSTAPHAASGIPFRQSQLLAAHRAYAFGTVLRVTNLRDQRSVHVRVVDRLHTASIVGSSLLTSVR